MNDRARTIMVAGAGSIGVAFAIVFARAGFRVHLWDKLPEALIRARTDIAQRLEMLKNHDLLSEEISTIANRVRFEPVLKSAFSGAVLVQECIPEDLALKRSFFCEAARLTVGAILASSTSALKPSTISTGQPFANRFLVAHPANPPYLLPIIELAPAPEYEPSLLVQATSIYREAGLTPVHIRKEIEGFIFNRLQGAVLREAYCLVRDEIASVEDIDMVMRLALGRRWSITGPFETVDLNTRGGIGTHATKLGPAYMRMGMERGQQDPWTEELVAKVESQRRTLLPLDQWEARVRWRDENLMLQQEKTALQSS